MMTPTFAASLGVVIAAVLAYPMARTVLRYSAPGGNPCQIKDCGADKGTVPGLASAEPGQRLASPAPASSHAPAAPTGQATAAPGGKGREDGTPADGVPVLGYQTLKQGGGRFLAEITIPVPAGTSHPWKLQISYRSARIDEVWGARWRPLGEHAALLQSQDWWRQPSSHSSRVLVEGTGGAARPAGCLLNGRRCRFAGSD